MEKRNFNGPDFKYRVLWRRVVGSGPNWNMGYTTAPSFTVNGIGNFSAFEIKVQAVNEKGEGPEPDPVIGYSGEDGKLKKWLITIKHFSLTRNIPTLYSFSHITLSSAIVSQFHWKLQLVWVSH